MKKKLRYLFGLFSAMGLGYFIYQGSANYIVLSLIMFSFSAFVITFANMNMTVNKTHEINMYEKHTEPKDNVGGYIVTRKDLILIVLAFLICCGASFILGRSSTTTAPVDINQQQTININQALETFHVSVNINKASIEELKMLDGIGDSKAREIFNGRPYANIYDLLSKGIVGEDTFDKIRSVITVE